jgi:hypothetical protein
VDWTNKLSTSEVDSQVELVSEHILTRGLDQKSRLSNHAPNLVGEGQGMSHYGWRPVDWFAGIRGRAAGSGH